MDDLETLKRQATQLGVKFSHNIGADTLRERIAKAEAEQAAPPPVGGAPLAFSGDESGEDGENEPNAVQDGAQLSAQNAVEGMTVNCMVPSGRRRGGRRWPEGATEVPLSDWSPELAQALAADPMFIVTGAPVTVAQEYPSERGGSGPVRKAVSTHRPPVNQVSLCLTPAQGSPRGSVLRTPPMSLERRCARCPVGPRNTGRQGRRTGETQ